MASTVACPHCHSALRLNIGFHRRDEIWDGEFVCRKCKVVYPLFLERAILLREDDIHSWTAPIQELLGIDEPVESPLFLGKLKEIGIEKALEMAKDSEKKLSIEEASAENLQKLRSQVQYIRSWQWFSHKAREHRFWEALNTPSPSVVEFIETVKAHQPKKVVDLLSGSGSGVVALGNALPDSTQFYAIERDLRCLWIIHEKFRAIKKVENVEPIGADVRYLPFVDQSFEMATSMMGVQELVGIRQFLDEVSRILTDGGHYVALMNKEPWLYDEISADEYKKFAGETDLFVDAESFRQLAIERGLQPVKEQFFTEDEKELYLVDFQKR